MTRSVLQVGSLLVGSVTGCIALGFILLLVPATATAQQQGQDASTVRLSAAALERAADLGAVEVAPATDPEMASELPRRDLGRSEAVDLLEGVFSPELQSPAGIFDSLEVKKLLSPTAAVAAPIEGNSSSSSTSIGGGEGSAAHSASPVLLESSLPLMTVGRYGLPQIVDLGLEHSEGILQSAVPLEPIEIPEELGEGVALPDSGIHIELVGAPKRRSPSIVAESTATYPNVAMDTDYTVAPTPTGVETLTTLRSPDAPRSQEFALTLPEGASLVASGDGGAEVSENGEEILAIRPPTAIDASGRPVPADLGVSGSSITVTVAPTAATTWPVLVDPLYEGFAWQNGATQGYAGWVPWTNNGRIIPGFGQNAPGQTGLWIEAQHEYFSAGAQAVWTHGVPRLAEEPIGHYPTSFITNLSLQGMSLITSPGLPSPFLFGGIFDPAAGKWSGNPGNEEVWSWPGNASSWLQNATLNFENGTAGNRDKDAKLAYGMSLAVSEPGWLASPRAAYLAGASVQIADEDNPTVSNAKVSGQWVDQTGASPITVEAADTGLGVKSVTFGIPGQGELSINNPCGGQTQDPCPAHQTVSLGSYSPAKMPQGIDTIPIRAADVLWNVTPEAATLKVQVKVDHTKPTVALSGTMTEQAKLGSTLPQYTLKYSATDGTESAPQSGVASTEVRLDGQAVEPRYAPGCATRNCAISREWTITGSAHLGVHTVEVIATDAVGLSTTKTLDIDIQKDSVAPSIATSGAFFSGPEGWLNQDTYAANIVARDAGGSGLKSLTLNVDGGAVASSKVSCPAGGCEASIAKTLNMAAFTGGAHSVEVVATDAAGNVSTNKRTIYVNPSGVIPTTEASSTLEAVEATSEEQPIAPTAEVLDPSEISEGNEPSLVEGSNGSLNTTGTGVEATIARDPVEGFSVETLGTNISVQPVAVGPSHEDLSVKNGVAGISANSGTGTDTVIRPTYRGVTDFAAIREAAAPEEYSYTVELTEGQTLRSIDPQDAAVYFEDGSEAMLITAQPAHDSVGHAVDTSLAVTGSDIVTLTVNHRKPGVVYPVLGGTGYTVGYSTIEVIIPPPPPPPGEALEGPVHVDLWIAPPEPAPVNLPGEVATGSSYGMRYRQKFAVPGCAPLGLCEIWEDRMRGFWYYDGEEAWFPENREPVCLKHASVNYSISEEQCAWIRPNHQPYGAGYHITARTIFTVTEDLFVTSKSTQYAFVLRAFGDGFMKAHPTADICNPSRPGC